MATKIGKSLGVSELRTPTSDVRRVQMNVFGWLTGQVLKYILGISQDHQILPACAVVIDNIFHRKSHFLSIQQCVNLRRFQPFGDTAPCSHALWIRHCAVQMYKCIRQCVNSLAPGPLISKSV